MESVNTHKALSHKVFMYGFQSIDFFVVIGVPVLTSMIVKSWIVFLIMLVLCWKIGKKLKARPAEYFKSFFTYLATPGRLSVDKYKENIPGYLVKGATKCRK
ncbi:MAG TPA: hypothetical protein DCX95_00665 [Elusimicrobia bacterium]|nr:hypothetical protein [Elusimicrobiota bacterium]